MTMTTKQYWSGHVAAVKAQAISTRAYAQQHGLALSTLYYWQHKLKLTAATQANSEPTAATRQPSKFVSLHVNSPAYAARPMPTNCTLVLGAGGQCTTGMSWPPRPSQRLIISFGRCCGNGLHADIHAKTLAGP